MRLLLTKMVTGFTFISNAVGTFKFLILKNERACKESTRKYLNNIVLYRQHKFTIIQTTLNSVVIESCLI